MLDIRKIGLTAIALGLISSPVLAEQPMGRGDTAQPTQMDFQTFDQDNNGYVTADEFAANVDSDVSLEIFGSYDADTNGALNEEEFSKLSQNELEANSASGYLN